VSLTKHLYLRMTAAEKDLVLAVAHHLGISQNAALRYLIRRGATLVPLTPPPAATEGEEIPGQTTIALPEREETE